jgi:hypothetical protein
LQRGKHLAGYGGYLSLNESSAANDIGLPRPTEKDRMLLYDLDQYSRDLWGGKDVGYGGFKPQVQKKNSSISSIWPFMKANNKRSNKKKHQLMVVGACHVEVFKKCFWQGFKN